MPKIVDPDERRAAVAAAVLRVAARDGLAAASLRNVAEEAGLAIGSVRHYFADHDELILFTMRELVGRIDARVTAAVRRLLADAGTDHRLRAEALLAEFLPLDATRREEAELWLAFTTAGHTRPHLRPYARELQDSLRTVLAKVLTGGIASGALPASLDVELEAHRLSALLDGLTFQAVLEPDRVTPALMRRVLHSHLRFG
ncbi:TetR/AcrR family transcriptional regulator [Kitasatospora sp. NPDC001664]